MTKCFPCKNLREKEEVSSKSLKGSFFFPFKPEAVDNFVDGQSPEAYNLILFLTAEISVQDILYGGSVGVLATCVQYKVRDPNPQSYYTVSLSVNHKCYYQVRLFFHLSTGCSLGWG